MPKYNVDIEGQIHEWDRDTITVPELRELAGYTADQQMIEVDLKDNTERVLGEGDVIELKPGKGFAKKVTFKRG
jgi:Multiubiquitin